METITGINVAIILARSPWCDKVFVGKQADQPPEVTMPTRSLFFRVTPSRTVEAVITDYETARREGLVMMESLAEREVSSSDFDRDALAAAVAAIAMGGEDRWDPTNVAVYWPSLRSIPPYRWGDLANIVAVVSAAMEGLDTRSARKVYNGSIECLSILGRAYAALHDTLGGIDSGTGMMYSTYMPTAQWFAYSSGMGDNSFVRNVNEYREREARGRGIAWAI